MEVGTNVGKKDGANEGIRVGKSDGEELGLLEGPKEGTVELSTVGGTLGIEEGIRDGKEDGIIEGRSVGGANQLPNMPGKITALPFRSTIINIEKTTTNKPMTNKNPLFIFFLLNIFFSAFPRGDPISVSVSSHSESGSGAMSDNIVLFLHIYSGVRIRTNSNL